MICSRFISGLCPLPPTTPLNLTGWFAKPKPNPLPHPKKASGRRLKVLHISDLHIDPRYANGFEANCSSTPCCRENKVNTHSPNQTLFPAPHFGAYRCDTPFSLVTAALESIPVLTGTRRTGFDFTLYTGDIVSHDPDNQLSRDYVTYTETLVYDLFRRTLGTGPVYAALGNHDSYNQAQDAPHALGGALAQQFSWNYDHVAALWKHEGWIPQSAVDLARAHYAAYMVRRKDGLRVITLNTDLCMCTANYFNYINMTNPDLSGMLRFLTDELQAAEDARDSVWIMGHVLTGWDGTNPLQNPTDLFYQIVDRFSPHVIKGIFWGHTHEDQISIYYANNATSISARTAGAVAWIGPSLTPLTNLNSGFRVYEVDSGTFEILDAHTWKSDVNAFPQLDTQTEFGPTYEYEYSTREAYGAYIEGWGPNDPLNATWWHHVTEAMEANSTLVTVFNTFQGKSSVRSPSCTGDCVKAKICYIRSGSAPIARQNCIQGFGSVQSGG
ncbi:Metallo-dependent phosphatase-like protein [Earliella scabrosa]|nr:Metallo-dependent phosphatase-like protein [Earliella scabrosa]